jgi:hypothetical protein
MPLPICATTCRWWGFAVRTRPQTRQELRQTRGCHDGLLRRRAEAHLTTLRGAPFLPNCMLDRSNTILRELGHFSKCRRQRNEGSWNFNFASLQGLRLKSHASLDVLLVSFRARAAKPLLACSRGSLSSTGPPCHGAYARTSALPTINYAGYFIISMPTELKICSGSAR